MRREDIKKRREINRIFIEKSDLLCIYYRCW